MLMAAGALLGLIFGSFIAVIVVRWPQGRSAMRGRSNCDHCGAELSPSRLIPLLSYGLQRGKAACCGGAIDPVHPAAELLGAMIGAVSIAIAPDLPQAVAGAVMGWLLLALALLDLRHFWLPDLLTGALAIAGVWAGIAGVAPHLADRLIGGAVGFAGLAVVRLAYRRLRGREGMGAGDVKLFGAIGLWIGWRLLPHVLFGAAVSGLLWCVLLAATGRSLSGTSRLPFGLFLGMSAWGIWAGSLLWPALPV